MSGPFILIPLAVTDAMLTSSTIAEPASGEVAWNPATTYAIGDKVILTSTHRVYQNLVAGVNAMSPDVNQGQTPAIWLDVGQT